jgi:hypothetical protein
VKNYAACIVVMSDKVIEPEIENTSESHIKPVSRFTRWYRSPLFNVIIVGLISFTQPGIWNALNSKRADSSQKKSFKLLKSA